MSGPPSQELFELYKNGHSEAATAIFDRYVQRLIALVRERLSAKLMRRVDPEDVVQSAYRSFFVHAGEGEYDVAEAGDLWRLLAGIAINKLYGQVEKHTAAKRSIQREGPNELAAELAKSAEPTAAEAVAVYEQLQLALKALPLDEQFTLTASLQGQDAKQIAEALDKSERTVRRLLAQARQTLEQRLIAASEPAATGFNRLDTFESGPEAPLKYSDYTLERLIGAGGMGKVFRAKHKTSGQLVAIKALHKSRLTDERAVRQFVQESQLLTRLHHPNIMRVQGLGRFLAGSYFMVMDFVDGADLQSHLSGGPLSPNEALAVVAQVAAGVAYAHEHGIVHCDLKPANILVDKSGRMFVTDFGFAYLLADERPENRNQIGGTAGYLAPEVLYHGASPTPAADIYSLGALLFALCTGSPSTRFGDDVTDNLPPAVSEICRRCLAVDPKQRFESMTSLLEMLDASANS